MRGTIAGPVPLAFAAMPFDGIEGIAGTCALGELIDGSLIATGGAALDFSSDAIVAANSGLGSSSGTRGRGIGGATGAAATGGGASGFRRSPRKWLTLSTGSQSSNPSLQQWSSASYGFAATQRCASASPNGPACAPSIETYHSS